MRPENLRQRHPDVAQSPSLAADLPDQDQLVQEAQNKNPPPETLLDLPFEMHVLIESYLNPKDLRSLSETCRYFRDHIDGQITSSWGGKEQMRRSGVTFKRALKYYLYINSKQDPFIALLDECIENKQWHVDSSELTQRITTTLYELERDVKLYIQTVKLENDTNNIQPRETHLFVDLTHYRRQAILTKALMAIVIVFVICTQLIPGIMSTHRHFTAGDFKRVLFNIFCLLVLSKFFFEMCNRRLNEVMQTDRQFRTKIVAAAAANENDLEAQINSRNTASTSQEATPALSIQEKRMLFLWKKSKEFLLLGTQQLKTSSNQTNISLPVSTINIEKLKEDWGKPLRAN